MMSNSETHIHAVPKVPDDDLPRSLQLELAVRDPDCIRVIFDPVARAPNDEKALAALRMGAIALETAAGRIDAERIRTEGDRVLTELRGRLERHDETVSKTLEHALARYFDPENGHFEQRIARLVSDGGELEQVLGEALEGTDSLLGQTLRQHVGSDSPLMKLLDPEARNGLLERFGVTLNDELKAQRDRILSELSLDNGEGALRRLLRELEEKHGNLEKGVRENVERLVHEFTLDDENSALSRMAAQLRDTRQAVQSQLTLDDEKSALSRLRRELAEHNQAQVESLQALRREVEVQLAALATRQKADASGPQHGRTFEEMLGQFLAEECRPLGDVVEMTGASVGKIQRCKKGDLVIELGPDAAGAGARIVVEAKDQGGYALSAAREELETARKNRDAEIGLFVYSAETAPEGIAPFKRIGRDVFTVWNESNAHSDLTLQCALHLVRALAVRRAQSDSTSQEELTRMDDAITDIERQAELLEGVMTLAQTVENNGRKIREKVTRAHERVLASAETLRGSVGILRASVVQADAD